MPSCGSFISELAEYGTGLRGRVRLLSNTAATAEFLSRLPRAASSSRMIRISTSVSKSDRPDRLCALSHGISPTSVSWRMVSIPPPSFKRSRSWWAPLSRRHVTHALRRHLHCSPNYVRNTLSEQRIRVQIRVARSVVCRSPRPEFRGNGHEILAGQIAVLPTWQLRHEIRSVPLARRTVISS